jgi:hypothetical protein
MFSSPEPLVSQQFENVRVQRFQRFQHCTASVRLTHTAGVTDKPRLSPPQRRDSREGWKKDRVCVTRQLTEEAVPAV